MPGYKLKNIVSNLRCWFCLFWGKYLLCLLLCLHMDVRTIWCLLSCNKQGGHLQRKDVLWSLHRTVSFSFYFYFSKLTQWISEMHWASSTTYQNSLIKPNSLHKSPQLPHWKNAVYSTKCILVWFSVILSGPMQNSFLNPGIFIWFGWFSSSGQYPALVATYTHHLHSLPLIRKMKCSFQTLFWL